MDKHPSWGGDVPRIEAAGGLSLLASHADCCDPALIESIRSLAEDAVPAVRYQIASHLLNLYRTSREMMWSLLEGFAAQEKSRGVIQGLAWPLNQLAGPHGSRVAVILQQIWERIISGDGAAEVREMCVSIFVGLYVWQDEMVSRGIVMAIATSPEAHSKEVHHMLFQLRGTMTHEESSAGAGTEDAIRRRTFVLFSEVVSRAKFRVQNILDKNEESRTTSGQRRIAKN